MRREWNISVLAAIGGWGQIGLGGSLHRQDIELASVSSDAHQDILDEITGTQRDPLEPEQSQRPAPILQESDEEKSWMPLATVFRMKS